MACTVKTEDETGQGFLLSEGLQILRRIKEIYSHSWKKSEQREHMR